MLRPHFFSRSYHSIKLHWKRLLVELLVVFIGVYAAFWLNSYREEEHQREIQKKYYQSFKSELSRISQHSKMIASATDTLHNHYSKAIARGERPSLKVHPELDFPINMFIIRSAFNQQHFESIGTDYLVNISWGSNLITLLEKRLNLFQEKSRDLMLLTGGNPAQLYEEDGNLKPAYQWYLQDLVFVSSVAKNLVGAIDKGALPDTDRFLKELEQ